MTDDFRISGANDPCYQYKNILGMPSRKIIAGGIALICLILTLVVIAFAVMSSRCCITKIQQRERYAGFQSNLNSSVDPCDNFYEFTCGSFAENNVLPPDRTMLSNFDILQVAVSKKVKNIFQNTEVNNDLPKVVNNAIIFYDLCTTGHRKSADDEIKVLIDVLNQFGGWPILNRSSWNGDLFNWTFASAFITKNFNVDTVLQVSVLEKVRNDGKNIFIIQKPNLYSHYGVVISENTIFLDALLTSLHSSHTDSDFIDLMETEQKWIKLFYNDFHETPHLLSLSISELVDQIPEIDWFNYFSLILSEYLHARNKSISLSDIVQIEDMNYLKYLGKILSSDTFSKFDLASLFGWYAAREVFVLIPGAMAEYTKLGLYTPDILKSVLQDKCYSLVLSLFQCSLDYLYIIHSNTSGIQDSKVLTTYVRSAFSKILRNSVWLDNVSKENMIYELHEMKDIIGFLSYLNNKTEIDALYKHFPAVSDNLLEYNFKLQQYYLLSENSILPRSITHVSAYYIMQKNKYVFPLSLFNPPFYYLNGPSYLNFGAIGSITAHEMMHRFGTFDDESKYELLNLFSNTSSIMFEKYAECFKNQYDRYDAINMVRNNGTLTLRENIADSEGLRIAFEAYKKHEHDFGSRNINSPFKNYSPDQMFFISFGNYLCSERTPEALADNLHSFPELRVNGAVSNSESFALAFNCPKGSPMNPVEKCTIW